MTQWLVWYFVIAIQPSRVIFCKIGGEETDKEGDPYDIVAGQGL